MVPSARFLLAADGVAGVLGTLLQQVEEQHTETPVLHCSAHTAQRRQR